MVPGARFVKNRQLMKSQNRFQSGPRDSFDADLFGLGMRAGGAVEAHVIDESDGVMSERGGTLNEALRRTGATKEGEVGFGEEFH